MTVFSVAALVVGAILLVTGHLGAGLYIGWHMGRRAVPRPIQPLNVEPLVASVEQMRHDFGELSQLSRSAGLPEEFALLLARLTLSLDELHRSLYSRVCAKPAAPSASANDTPSAPEERSHRLGAHAIGNSRILQWFHDRPVGQCPPGEKCRYPFAVQQPLAVRKREELPAPGDFELVQCHDLSPVEIRYLVEDRPKDDEVVIGLGIPRPIKHLLARVEDYRSVYMYGRVGFLVTASFVAALDGYSHDPADQEEPESVR
jgi:hypothetical protein